MRGSVSLLFALIEGEPSELAGARGDSRGGGAIYAAAMRQQPSDTSRSPTHRTWQEIRARIVRTSSCGSRAHEGGRGGPRRANAVGLEHGAVAQEGIENPGEAASEGDDGHRFAAARGDPQGPGAQGLGLGRVAAEEGDGGLNQEPAGARVAGLGDRTPALGLARAVLAGHEAEIGFEVMGVAEALGVVDSGEEGGGGDGADARDGAQTRHARILDGEVLDGGVGIHELPVEGRRRASSGATTESNRPGRGKSHTRVTKVSALPDGTR